MSVPQHTHPELEDRLTAELTLLRTEINSVNARIEVLRQETRRGFTDITQVLGQVLARLPESREGDAGDG
jgi:hypothetical protein